MDSAAEIDEILEKLIHDVELSVHSFYRGELRQDTQRIRNESNRKAARHALMALLATDVNSTTSATPSAAGDALSPEEAAAAMRCVISWLPMGTPGTANPQSRCVPAGRELCPSWGEREKARLAIRRSTV